MLLNDLLLDEILRILLLNIINFLFNFLLTPHLNSIAFEYLIVNFSILCYHFILIENSKLYFEAGIYPYLD